MQHSIIKAPTFRLGLLAVILVIAMVLRLIEVNSLPLWMDEAYSYWFSNFGWSYLWTEVPKFENHPPAYFLLLKAWRTFVGASEVALRIPSVLASLGSIVAVFAAGRILGESLDGKQVDRGWSMGLLAATLAALSQFEITYAGEARPYAFASFGTALMLAGALRILCDTPARPDGTRSLPAAILLVLGMSVTLWSHSLGLVPVGLTGLFLIGWWAVARRGDAGVFLRLAAMAAAVTVLCWPHFINTLSQLSRDYSAFWIEAPSFYKLFTMTYRVAGLPGLPFGAPIEALVAAFGIGAGLVGLWRLGRGANPALALLPVVLAGGYWIVVVAYTYLNQPVLLDRTLIFIRPPVVLILAAAPWTFVKGRRQGILGAGLVVLAALAQTGPNELMPGWRFYGDISRRIAAENPEAPVLAMPGEAQILLEFYENRLDVDFDIVTIPGPFPSMVDGLPDMINVPDLSLKEIDPAVQAVEEEPVVWVLVRRNRKAGETLRARMRALGWSEEFLMGEAPRDEAMFLRYTRSETAGQSE